MTVKAMVVKAVCIRGGQRRGLQVGGGRDEPVMGSPSKQNFINRFIRVRKFKHDMHYGRGTR